ncbi:MAG: ATP-binding protein, partial [Bacteroidales bacterium]|nr:ATP-binding protein [Bacteroidales bacterium]
MSKLFTPLRLVFYITAVLIILTSTWFSNRLAKELSEEEQEKIELWAEAIRTLAQDNKQDIQMDYALSLKIIEGNTNIPVILTDKNHQILSHANLQLRPKHKEADLEKRKNALISKNRCIKIKLARNLSQYIFYDDSKHLKQLRYFPYVQLGVMFLFLAITILTYGISKKSEQNRIWVGLSKETAHQLGTPISSLMAWVEI